MSVLFTRLYPVIRRTGGSYVEGRFVRAADPAPASVALNVQPTDDGWVAFGAMGALNVDPEEGDIVVINGERAITVAVQQWDTFAGEATAHDRYTLRPEVPKAPGET